MTTTCLRCRVTGRVQGVWFRGATREKARELGVSGYAENLTDGSVEVLIHGEEPAVSAMLRWLERGPPMARVASVDSVLAQVPSDLKGFYVR